MHKQCSLLLQYGDVCEVSDSDLYPSFIYEISLMDFTIQKRKAYCIFCFYRIQNHLEYIIDECTLKLLQFINIELKSSLAAQENNIDFSYMLKQSLFIGKKYLKRSIDSLIICSLPAGNIMDATRSNDSVFQNSIKKTHLHRMSRESQRSFSTIKEIRIETGQLGTIPSEVQNMIVNDKTEEYNSEANRSTEVNKEYVDYLKIYQENKRRLAQNSLQQNHFDSQYLRDNLIKTKYFYADIVNVASSVVENFISKVESPSQQRQIIDQIHLHFLLYVYHLYPKESKNFKQSMTTLIDHFLIRLESAPVKDFKIEQNLEFHVYLRKFIETEAYQGNGNKVNKLAQNYCLFLKTYYLHEKSYLSQQNSTTEEKSKISHQITLKAQLLHSYLLAFPNVWILNKQNISTEQPSYQKYQKSPLRASEEIIAIYDNFVEEFSTLFSQSIQLWLDPKSSNLVFQTIPTNFSYKRSLSQEFKQLELNKCFNQMKLIIHRLFVIADSPKFSSASSNYEKAHNKKQQNERQAQDQFTLINQKYHQNKINVLTYLPSQKYSQNDSLLMMRLLILMKNIFSYHILRHIDNQKLTSYLIQLFENNSNIINSTNSDLKREIKFSIGELISRLCSGGWVDYDDKLHKYYENSIELQEKQIKGRRNSKGEWYEVNDL